MIIIIFITNQSLQNRGKLLNSWKFVVSKLFSLEAAPVCLTFPLQRFYII